MGFFNSLVGLFKPSGEASSGEAPKEEEGVSDCCRWGECTCGVSSSTENEDTITTSITVTNSTTAATSNFPDEAVNITISTPDDINPTPITEATSITKLRPAVKNEVTEENSVQLEFDLSDTVETKAPVPVVPALISSPSETSTRNKVRKSKLKKAKKKRNRNT